jgi:hypothetical protein
MEGPSPRVDSKGGWDQREATVMPGDHEVAQHSTGKHELYQGRSVTLRRRFRIRHAQSLMPERCGSRPLPQQFA